MSESFYFCRQRLDDIHNRKEPCIGLFIIETTYLAFLKDHRQDFIEAPFS